MQIIDLKGRGNTQIEVRVPFKSKFFFSFQTLIAEKDSLGNVWLDKNSWDYSHTTLKYLGRFLDEKTKVIRDKVKKGEYKLADLSSGISQSSHCCIN
jgi:hypothetical protein